MSVMQVSTADSVATSNALLHRLKERIAASSVEKSFTVTNPADGSIVAKVPDLGAPKTEKAIALANDAQVAWAGLTAGERGAILRRWHDLILASEKELGEILTLE